MNQQQSKGDWKTTVFSKAYGAWWMLLLEGICLIIICGLTLFMPGQTLNFLVMILGIDRIVMGTFYVIAGIVEKKQYGTASGFSMGRGVFDIIVGLVFLLLPTTIISIFIFLIGLWAIIIGIGTFIWGLNTQGRGKSLTIIVGVLLTIFGILSFVNPINQATFFVSFIGVVLGCLGVYMITMSFSVRSMIKEQEALRRGYTDYDIE